MSSQKSTMSVKPFFGSNWSIPQEITTRQKIDINAILVEPLKSRKDTELTRAYHVLVMRLKNAGIIPRKHVLDNKVSSTMKEVIRDKYRMEMELFPPGCHRRNAAEVAI